jgi:hypothetical protein
MKVLIRITKDMAMACIMQELYFNKGVIKKMNINIFRKQMSDYAFAYGQSHIHDHQDDYDEYYQQALEIVNKYFK